MPPPPIHLRSSLHRQPSAGALQFPGHDPAFLLEQPCGALQQPDRSFPLVSGALASRKPGAANYLLQSASEYIISVVHGSYLLLPIDNTAPSILPGPRAQFPRRAITQRG